MTRRAAARRFLSTLSLRQIKNMYFSVVCYSNWALFLNTSQVQAKRFGWTVTAQIKAELPDPFNDAILLTGCARLTRGSRCQPSPDEKRLKPGPNSPESS